MKPLGIKFILKLLGIAIGFTAYIIAAYIWVAPKLFPEGTSLIYISGVITSAFFGGLIGFRSNCNKNTPSKSWFAVRCAVLIAVIVAYSSMFVILNTLGS